MFDHHPLISIFKDDSSIDKYARHTLYGKIGGGQLEFVKMEEFNWRMDPNIKMVRLYFTNHDVQATKDCELSPENNQNQLLDKQYFIIEVPKFN